MNGIRYGISGACALALLGFGGAPARAYDYNGAPTGGLILKHGSADVKARIQDGWRPTSIEAQSPIGTYWVNYVRNTGSHKQDVRYEGEMTWEQLKAVIDSGWRIEDVETAGSRLSGILIKNSLNPRTTLPFWGWSHSKVEDWLKTNSSYRILDLDRYESGGSEQYSGVFIQNTGAAHVSGWGWGAGWAYEAMKAWVKDNKMRLIDLDRRPDGKYAWVAVSRKPGERYYYFGNRTMTQLLDLLGGAGLRAQTMNETTINGERRYSGTAVNNAGDQAARLGDLAEPRHAGFQGFYLKQVGGSTLVDLNADRSMHPSSTIKALLHFTGVHTTDADKLNTRLVGGLPMPAVHAPMMFNSDNGMANKCLDAYSTLLIESVGHSVIGMSNTTQIRNRFGTGGPYGNDSITTTTLTDLGKLYEKVDGGHFSSTKDAWFRTNMLNETRSNLFDAVLTSVRDDIGISAAKFNDYKSRIRFIFKAGSNSQSDVTGYWSCAGLATLPRKSGGAIQTRSYVFGHFVNQSSTDYTAGFEATREILREQIRETMLTFK